MTEGDTFFQRLGWVKLGEADGLPTYFTEYAAVGLACVDSAEEVLDRWQEWQSALFKLKSSEAIGSKKDLYLLFVLQEENLEALRSLQRVTDDTHVCRKIVLSRRGRTIARTLMDTSLFQTVEHAEETSDQTSAAEANIGVQALTDLAKKSAHVIFDNLLEGEYRSTGQKE